MPQDKFSHRERVYEHVVDWALRQSPPASLEPPRICWDRYAEEHPIWTTWYELRAAEIFAAMQRRSTYGGGAGREAPRARPEGEAGDSARGKTDDATPPSGVYRRVS
jgi:hypothetical protein